MSDFIKPGLAGDTPLADLRREEFDIKNEMIFTRGLPVDICFIGDSITHFWDTAAAFGDYGAVINRGNGGDACRHILRRFEADGLQLKGRGITVCLPQLP